MMLALSAALACGGEAPRQSSLEPTDRSLSAAPDQYACSADEECVSAPWHLEDHPCCNAPYTAPQSSRFVAWRDVWQRESCAEVDCEAILAAELPTSSPAQPAPCYFEPRCDQSRCRDSCDATR